MTELTNPLDLDLVIAESAPSIEHHVNHVPTLAELGLDTPKKAYDHALESPGLTIAGLGDLPEAAPLSNPTFAHKAKEGIPSEEEIKTLEKLQMDYGNSRSIAYRIGHGPAMYFIDCMTPGRHIHHDENTGEPVTTNQPFEYKHSIHEYVDYRRRRIRKEIVQMYPTLGQDFHAWSEQSAQLEYNKSLADAVEARKFSLHMLNRTKGEYPDKITSEFDEAEHVDIERRYKSTVEMAERRRDENNKSPRSLIHNLEEYASYVKENTPDWFNEDERKNIPARLKAQTLAVIQSALYNIKHQIEPEFTYDINSKLDKVRYNKSLATPAAKREGLISVMDQYFNSLQIFDKYPEYKQELISNLADQEIAHYLVRPEHSFSIHNVDRCMSEHLPPQELILDIYDQETKSFVVQDPPKDDEDIQVQFMVTLTPTSYGTGPDNPLQSRFSDFIKWKHKDDPAYAQELMRIHEEFDQLCESDRSDRRHFIGNDRLEINGMARRKEALNLQLIEPGIPSVEALKEIQDRHETRKPSIEPAFVDEWKLTTNVLSALNYVPNDWYWWAKSTKRLGLGGRAARARNEVLRHVVSPIDFRNGTGSFTDSSSEHRFPSKEEIKEKATQYEKNIVYTGRNAGFDAYNNLVVPIRIDQENNLHKYDFTSQEIVDFANQAYQVMAKDYYHGNHPDSQIASLRTSLLGVIGGHHEQWYKHQGISISDGEARLDELDVILFLPSIAAENNYDTGVFLTGMKLVLQMDSHLRRMYAPLIKECLKRTINGNPQLNMALEMALTGNHRAGFVTAPKFTVNASHHTEKRAQHDEIAITEALQHPETIPHYGGYNVLAVTRHWDDLSGSRPTEIIGLLTQEQYNQALAIVRQEYPTLRSDDITCSYEELQGYKVETAQAFEQAVGQVIGRSLGSKWVDTGNLDAEGNPEKRLVENIDIRFLSINPEDRLGSFDTKVYANTDETYANKPEDLAAQIENAFCLYTLSSTWTDPDIGIDRKTRSLVARDKERNELVAPGASSAMERLAMRSGELAHTIEKITARAENTELTPLHTTAQIVEILIGQRLPTDNLAELMGWFNRIEQVGAQIRGSNPEERKRILVSLNDPLNIDNLSQEGFIEQVWLASGVLEREAVARNIIDATSSAFRISVHRIMDKLHQYDAANMAIELEEVMEISSDEATAMAIDAIAKSTYDRVKDIAEKTDQLFEVVDHDQETRQYRQYLKTLGNHIDSLMQDIAKHTDYHYASNHWLQIMDQIAGEDFEDSEGKINLYCVQASYLLHELVMDTLEPLKEKSWQSPMEVFIAIEDEGYNQSPEEFLQRLQLKIFSQEDKTKEGYDHYFVCVKMPKKNMGDKQYYMLADQTVNQVRIFSEDALISDANNALIIDNQKARLVSQSNGIVRPESHQTRILLAQNNGDQSMSMVGHLLNKSSLLHGYSEELEGFNPQSLINRAVYEKYETSIRISALRNLVAQHPYFIGIEGFDSPSEHFAKLTTLQELAQEGSLPLVGLFTARVQQSSLMTIATMKETPDVEKIESRATQFIELAALMPELDWEQQRTMYEHIVTAEDMKVIKKRRVELENIAAQKRKELSDALNSDLVLGLKKTKADTVASIELEAKEKSSEHEEIADELGSPQRLKNAMIIADLRAVAMDQQQSQRVPMLPENATSHTHVQSGSIITTQQPLEIAEMQSRNAAEFLLSNIGATGMSQRLSRISANWRAFVREARMSDPVFAQKTWAVLNASLAHAEQNLKITLPLIEGASPGQPLGPISAVVNAPAQVLQALIQLSSQRALPTLLAENKEVWTA